MTEKSSATPISPQTTSLTWLAFIVVIILGGSNSVAVLFSNAELPPFWGAAFRFFAAALIFWIIVLIRRIPIPQGKALRGILIYGFLSIGVNYALLYWALLSVTASLTMVVLSIGPLLTFLFASAYGQEKFHWRGLGGGLIAFIGIGIGVGNQIGSTVPMIPLLAVLAAAVVISAATVYYKSFPPSDPLIVNALALSVGAVSLLILSLVTGETQNLPTMPQTWIAFGYLVVGGSGLLFYLYLYILERWSASATSYTFLLFPVATVILGAWLANEVISPRFLLGSTVVLGGVWLGAIAKPRRAKSE